MHRFNNNTVSFGFFVEYQVVFKAQQFSKVGVTFRNYFWKEFGAIVLMYPISLHWYGLWGIAYEKKALCHGLRNIFKNIYENMMTLLAILIFSSY